MADSQSHPTIQEHSSPLDDLYKLIELRKIANRVFPSLGLRLNDAFLLIFVSDGVIETQELLALMGVHSSALSLMARRMAEQKLLVRKQLKGDQRLVSYELTPKGKKVVKAVKEAWLSEHRHSLIE